MNILKCFFEGKSSKFIFLIKNYVFCIISFIWNLISNIIWKWISCPWPWFNQPNLPGYVLKSLGQVDFKTVPGFDNWPRFVGAIEQNKISNSYENYCITVCDIIHTNDSVLNQRKEKRNWFLKILCLNYPEKCEKWKWLLVSLTSIFSASTWSNTVLKSSEQVEFKTDLTI